MTNNVKENLLKEIMIPFNELLEEKEIAIDSYESDYDEIKDDIESFLSLMGVFEGKKIPSLEVLDIIAKIIDTFEEYLDENSIEIPNEEKLESTDDNYANIYGIDYFNIEDYIKIVFDHYNLIKNKEVI